MREISLTRGLVAIVDDEDFAALAEHKWCAHNSGFKFYAARRVVNGPYVLMHRFILDAPAGIHVDHISGNGLDNRRGNLRLATNAQNVRNSALSKSNTSGYKGVHWHRGGRRWLAQITADGRNKYLGLFDSPVEAHAAYCAAAKELHGEFARFA